MSVHDPGREFFRIAKELVEPPHEPILGPLSPRPNETMAEAVERIQESQPSE